MVNWNGGELAVEAARAVAAQRPAPDLWVVDNDSRDGSGEAIARACPAARVIRNGRNLGFAAANNQALRHFLAEADYVLLINNDALLPEPDSLARAVGHLAEDPEVHGVVGRYVFPDGGFQKFYNQLPTPLDLVANWGFGRHFRPLRESRRMRRFHLSDEDFGRPLSIEQPAFACVLMRGASMRAVGLLDERFPIFFNDVDYCWRWRERGFNWRYLPDWTVVHAKSRSTARIGGLLKAEFASTAARSKVRLAIVTSAPRCLRPQATARATPPAPRTNIDAAGGARSARSSMAMRWRSAKPGTFSGAPCA